MIIHIIFDLDLLTFRHIFKMCYQAKNDCLTTLNQFLKSNSLALKVHTKVDLATRVNRVCLKIIIFKPSNIIIIIILYYNTS